MCAGDRCQTGAEGRSITQANRIADPSRLERKARSILVNCASEAPRYTRIQRPMTGVRTRKASDVLENTIFRTLLSTEEGSEILIATVSRVAFERAIIRSKRAIGTL